MNRTEDLEAIVISKRQRQNRLLRSRIDKPINCRIPASYQNPNQSDAVVTSAAHRGFAALRDQITAELRSK